MDRALRLAWFACAVTLALVAFVAATAYSTARDKLADSFADAQYLTSLETARHLKNKYDAAGLGLRLLAQERAARGTAEGAWLAGSPQTALLRVLLDDAPLTYLRLDRDGRPLERHPASGELPPREFLAVSFTRSIARQRPVPVVYRTASGAARLVMVLPVEPQPGRRTAGLALLLDLAPFLRPVVRDQQVDSHLLVIDPASLVVQSATLPVPERARLTELIRVDSQALLDGIKAGKGGKEHNALSRPELGLGPPQPVLLGLQGLDLGGEDFCIAAVAARKPLVEGFLALILRWMLLIGTVVVLGMASFVGLVTRSKASVEQEQRRSEERHSLLKISQSLLSERSLQEVLTRISDEAVALFRAEGATIALVDEETDEIVFHYVSSRRQEVVAQLQGLRLKKDQGLLGWVVSTGQAVVVNEAKKDRRVTKSVDEKTGGQTQSLLCAPLVNQKGECFGAVELVNNLDTPFQDSDLVLLRSLAVTASAAVERAVFLEREAAQQRLQREMEIARTVQQGLLPRSFPKLPGLTVAGHSDPAREVGGDFYDFIPVGDHHLGLVIADVADKGLGAAMFMVMCRSLLYSCAHRELSPAKVLEELNSRILEVSSSDLFVTVFYGLLDVRSRRLTYTNGGHNPPLLYRFGSGVLSQVKLPGMALGVLEPLGLDEATIDLAVGDRLVLYTDGVTDAINPRLEQFGTDRLAAVVAANGDHDAAATVAAVRTAVETHVEGEPQFDDITLAVLQVTTQPGETIDWLAEVRARG
ncbi:MAG: SpoIIE family protein phosphatase [Fimbriimonadaceae bacterium]|nr:SpoIIE family protein phosphatase [Fimbriimonadaceae bacterium]